MMDCVLAPPLAEVATGAGARVHAIPLDWHCGFRLAVKDIPDEFRGPAVPRLARRIAGEGTVDAAAIGTAQRSLRLHPEEWREWGSHGDILQHLKQLWHVLVHYGEPAVASGTAA